ncbi:hypothetical protein DJ72_07545, partial [Halorubrum distributum]
GQESIDLSEGSCFVAEVEDAISPPSVWPGITVRITTQMRNASHPCQSIPSSVDKQAHFIGWFRI